MSSSVLCGLYRLVEAKSRKERGERSACTSPNTSAFKITPPLIAFMRANPFAILVSTTTDGPFATHVPVVIRETADHT